MKRIKPAKPTRLPRSPQNKRRLWLNTLLFIYIALLVWLVLFKLGFRIPHRPRGFNFIPFYSESFTGLLWDVALNVCAFLPLGIYLKMIGLSTPKTVLGGAAGSLFFELTQLAFAMGRTDITDLITNTLGTLCGAGLYLLLGRLTKHSDRLDRRLLITATVVTGLSGAYFVLELVSTLILL